MSQHLHVYRARLADCVSRQGLVRPLASHFSRTTYFTRFVFNPFDSPYFVQPTGRLRHTTYIFNNFEL